MSANEMQPTVAQEPQPGGSRQGNEDDDEFPRSLYVCNAIEATNITIVYTPEDLTPDHPQRSFKPAMVYQVYGEGGKIFGYRNLSVDIYYLANSARCFVDLKHNAIITRGPSPDNVIEKLAAWLPEQYSTDKKQFLELIARERHNKIFGRVIQESNIYNSAEETTYNYIFTECSVAEPGFAEFHSRFQCMIVWFIESASQIDVTDPAWMFFYVYEQRQKPGTRRRRAYYPVGFCTLYKFFHFPDKLRARISQVFIMPPCQRGGIGTILLQSAYKAVYKIPNVIDMTVEDPCPAFVQMRDTLDCKLLVQLEDFKYPAIKKGFSTQMFLIANRQFKINKRQCRHVYEILRLYYALASRDREELQKVHDEIRARFEAPLIREERAVRRRRIINDPLRNLTNNVYQPAETRRALKKSLEAYLNEMTDFVNRLSTKLRE